MEADWEMEIGGDAPVIEGEWQGFVDLRRFPECATGLPETGQVSGLAEALIRLNDRGSPVWTSKTDVFVPDAVDGDELDAPAGSASYALACYVDVLPRSDQQWIVPAMAALACNNICGRLRKIDLRCCRVDLVVRQALIVPDELAHGITAYLTGCGTTMLEARTTLGKCLAGFAEAMVAPSSEEVSKLQ